MEIFSFLSKYFWLVCIGGVLANFLLIDRIGTSEEDRKVDPQRRRKYLAWFWGLNIVPWLVMGFGQIVGGVPHFWAYFRPQDLNPYVWAFYASILVLYLLAVYWVFFRDGARIAAELRLFKFHTAGSTGAVSAFWIKVIAVALLPFLVIWLWVAASMDIVVPM